MPARKSSTKSAQRSTGGSKAKPKNSLVANINRRKKAGTSRPRKDSTVSAEAYDEMQQGWPKSKKAKSKKAKSTKSGAKKRAAKT